MVGSLFFSANPAPDRFARDGAQEKDSTVDTKLLTAIASAFLVSCTAAATTQGQAGVKRTDLQRHDLSVENRETVQARIDIPPGVTAPWHRHPGEEVIYVIEGTLEYQLEGKPPATFKAGEVLFVPAGVAHKARNPGPLNGAELATYIVEKGKPLVVPAPEVGRH